MPQSQLRAQKSTARARRVPRQDKSAVLALLGNRFSNARPWVKWALGFVLLVAGLCVVRFEIIDSPPYYDFATGIFVEANFLADTNFNYRRLVQDEARWMEGGAAVYITSIVPTLLAILMRLCPSPRGPLVIYHVATFGCAALIMLFTFAILRPKLGPWGAALSAGMLMTAPLFSVQIDMLGMDLPMAACGLLAVLLMARQHYIWAALIGGATSLFKASGRVTTFALVVYLAALVVAGRNYASPAVRRKQWAALGLNLVVMAAQAAVADWVSRLPHSEIENWWRSKEFFFGANGLNLTPYWFPDQLAVFFFCLIGTAALAAAWVRDRLRPQRKPGPTTPLGRAIYEWLLGESPLALSWIVLAGMVVSVTLIYALPRYFMIMVPPLYLVFGSLLFRWPRWRAWGLAGACLLVAFNLANASGRFFPPLPNADRTGALLERSREYLLDHRSNIQAVRRLATTHPDATVVCGVPFVHFLSLPRLGYVDRPMKGYSLNRFTTATFASGVALPDACPRDAVLIAVNNPFGSRRVPPPQPGDEEIYDDRQRSPLVIYRKKWPNQVPKAVLATWYSGLVSPQRALIAKAHELANQGQLDEALETYYRALDIRAEDADAHYGAAYVLFLQNRRDEAIKHLEQVIAFEPSRADAHSLWGIILANQGNPDDSLRHLATALKLDPQHPATHKTLGKVYLLQGRLSDAVMHFERSLALRGTDAEVSYLLATALVAQGDTAAAAGQFRHTLELQPDSAQAANELAWILATDPREDLRDGPQAVRLAEQACEKLQTEAGAWDTLAAAYAEAGRFDDAVKTAQQALDLALRNQQATVAEVIQKHLACFQQGRPYRESPGTTGQRPTSNGPRS